MTPAALGAFISEYGLTMPIGVDEAASDSRIPVTMARFAMQGTPTAILIGRDGQVQYHGFGKEDDMALGSRIARALG
jgi:hypothetical protein